MVADKEFKVVVETVERGQTVVSVEGDLDLWGATKLHRPLMDALDSPVVVVDLTGCEFCDSSGLRTLLQAVTWSEQHEVSLRLAGVGTTVLRVLELTGLLPELSLFPDVPSALKD